MKISYKTNKFEKICKDFSASQKAYGKQIAIPPGETIKDELEFLGMNQKEFSKRLGLAEKTVSQIINGIAPITYETSIKLENVLGIPASTWNNLESQYRVILARIEEEEKKEEEWKICQKFPYKEIMKNGWIKNTKDNSEIIKELKTFFGVASLNLINSVEEKVFDYYNKLTSSALFKKNIDKEICEYSMATWIRKGEIEASKISCNIFNKEVVQDKIIDMKKLSTENKKESIDKLKEICASSGIALVIIPHMSKTYVDGVSKWIGKDKALIILSNRGKKLDKFWFNFFHELAHLLKHSKKDLFINAKETSTLEIETEANNYAREILISSKDYNLIKKSAITEDTIKDYAKANQIHPSILVGRLQYEEIIPYNRFNSLKEDIVF